MSPRVTIITRTKDRPAAFVARAAQSVLGQTLADWKHYWINDGGDAEALEAALAPFREAYGDRLHLDHLTENVGMAAAAKRGLSAATGEFVCLHDDDDVWAATFLATLTSFLEEQGADSPYQAVVSQTTQVIEHFDEATGFTAVEEKPYMPLPHISLFRLGYENPFPPIALLVRRRAMEAVGGYKTRFGVAADMDFNLRLLQQFEIGTVSEPLAFYHIREEAESEATGNSITRGQSEHRLRNNEFKNHYLRQFLQGKDKTGLALNLAPYLVQNEWMLTDVFARGQRVEERLVKLCEELCAGWEDWFGPLREGVAMALDAARDPAVREQLDRLAQNLTAGQQQLSKNLNWLSEVLPPLAQEAAQGSRTQAEQLSWVAQMIVDMQETKLPALLEGQAAASTGQEALLAEIKEGQKNVSANQQTLLDDLQKDRAQLQRQNEMLMSEMQAQQALLEQVQKELSEHLSERRRRLTMMRLGPLHLTWVKREPPLPHA